MGVAANQVKSSVTRIMQAFKLGHPKGIRFLMQAWHFLGSVWGESEACRIFIDDNLGGELMDCVSIHDIISEYDAVHKGKWSDNMLGMDCFLHGVWMYPLTWHHGLVGVFIDEFLPKVIATLSGLSTLTGVDIFTTLCGAAFLPNMLGFQSVFAQVLSVVDLLEWNGPQFTKLLDGISLWHSAFGGQRHHSVFLLAACLCPQLAVRSAPDQVNEFLADTDAITSASATWVVQMYGFV